MELKVMIIRQQIQITLVVQMVVQAEAEVVDTKEAMVEFMAHQGVTHRKHLCKALAAIPVQTELHIH
jgi:hypothetical protein